MLLEEDLAVRTLNTAPVTASVTYVAGGFTILVPVYPLDSLMTVFAPPFVIPGGNQWTVIFTVQTDGPVFDTAGVKFSNLPSDLPTPASAALVGLKAWQSTFDTTGIKNPVEVFHCHITLNGPAGAVYVGDPSIAVVQDPMGG
jgi:hypothetical protein